jgi:hypothetical protein
MCLIPAEIIRAALDMPISRELWEMIDAAQRCDLPEPAWPDLRPDEPLTLIAPLTAEEIAAGDEADAARLRLDAKLRELYRHPAPRALNCGRRSPTIHLRRDRDAGAVEDALIRFSCGRSECPHCWRRRLSKTYRRAGACLLDASRDSRLPRLGMVHVAETTELKWETLDKAMRREYRREYPERVDAKGRCNVGRLRVRRCDNTVLVVSAEPFRGSRSVTPAEALDIVSAAIDLLHTAKHSFRLLGDWSDSQESEWRQVAVYTPQVSLADVQAALAELAVKTRAFSNPDLQGLVWRVQSEAHAMHLEVVLAPVLCPTLSQRDCTPFRPKSDTPPDEGEIDGDGWTPFDDPDGDRWT